MSVAEQIDRETELKERLYTQIDNLHDFAVLEGVSLLLEKVASSEEHQLTEEEAEAVDEGIQQSEAGLGIPHETFRAEVMAWFQARK